MSNEPCFPVLERLAQFCCEDAARFVRTAACFRSDTRMAGPRATQVEGIRFAISL